jgi:hypothetical protein
VDRRGDDIVNERIDAATRSQIAADIAFRVHAICPDAVVTEGPNCHVYPADADYLLEIFNVPSEQQLAVHRAALDIAFDVLKRLKRFVVVIILSAAPPAGARVVTEAAASQEAAAR